MPLFVLRNSRLRFCMQVGISWTTEGNELKLHTCIRVIMLVDWPSPITLACNLTKLCPFLYLENSRLRFFIQDGILWTTGTEGNELKLHTCILGHYVRWLAKSHKINKTWLGPCVKVLLGNYTFHEYKNILCIMLKFYYQVFE